MHLTLRGRIVALIILCTIAFLIGMLLAEWNVCYYEDGSLGYCKQPTLTNPR